MKILITGATGLVGTALLEQLFLNQYDDVNVLTRNKAKAESKIPFPVSLYTWEPENNYIEEGALENVDIIIHLAGENIAEGRWSTDKKTKILKSRTLSTKLLLDEIKKLKTPPKKLISSSAIGIYGDRADESLNENSSLGEGFLAQICKDWEENVLNHDIKGMQVHCLRTGIVLSNQGGALKKMLLPFQLGIGGQIANGKQYMSWIHIDDLVGQIIFLIQKDGKHKIYNAVSPRPVTNYIFTKIFGRVISRPTMLPIPKFALKIIFGEMSQILTEGQMVLPKNFMDEGYEFKFRSLRNALNDILNNNLNGQRELLSYQWVNKRPEEIFEFFSNEYNLEKLTPLYLNFEVVGKDTKLIETGTTINYKLKLHGIPLKWKSKIKSFRKNHSFIDEQLKGPYAKWHHYHGFIPSKNGTLIQDHVHYRPPLGKLGLLVAGAYIKNDLNKIFGYRKKVINEIFPN